MRYMITTEVTNQLAQQIQRELSASYAYYGLHLFFTQKSLNGFARWSKQQAIEELTHADKIMSHLLERDAVVEIYDIQQAETSFKTPLEALQYALTLEQDVTHAILHLKQLAHEQRDFQTSSFLNWFLDEQVEEIAELQELCQRLSLAADDMSALLFLDNQIGKARTKTLIHTKDM